jgi:hypothetical protein
VTDEGQSTTRLQALVFATTLAAVWSVTGRYWGMQHDAQFYVAQALGKSADSALRGDLFLRFNSQDDFTLFPYLCAVVIDALGIDYAAALVTFLLLIGWIVAAWHLGRALTSERLAWLGTGLLVAIPGWYGAGMVFRTAEPFLSARPAAEVAALCALIALVRDRRVLAVGCLLLAFLMHPLMAFPAALVVTGVLLPWSRSRGFWPLASVSGCLAALAGAWILGGDAPLMSGLWLSLTESRSNYLFAQNWLPQDWQANLLPLATVFIASHSLDSWAARLSRAAFWIAVSGLSLAAISGALPLELLVQGQPWRWIWPACVLALLLLPSVTVRCWRGGPAERGAAMTLLAGWTLAQWSSADEIAPVGAGGLLAIVATLLWVARAHLTDRLGRAVGYGAIVLLGTALVGLALSVVALSGGRFDFGTDPVWVQSLSDVLNFPAAAALIVGLVWWLVYEFRRPVATATVALVSAALLLAAAPGAAATWLAQDFSGRSYAKFEHWRTLITPDSEVLWVDGLQETWFLLGRKSYLSISQLGGIVFSERLADEAWRRAHILAPMVAPGFWFFESSTVGSQPARMNPRLLQEICVVDGPDFIVSDRAMGNQVATAEFSTRAQRRYLYDCRRVREAPEL